MNNWKMKCIDGCGSNYTAGKIYEVTDGTFVCDNGYKQNEYLSSFEEWQEFSVAKWKLIEAPKQALEVECYNIENVVLFKVLHQDDEKIERGNFKFKASNRVEIISGGCPTINNNALSICGCNKNLDKTIDCLYLYTEAQAKQCVEKIYQAVAELNESLADKPTGRWKPNYDEIYWGVSVFNKADNYINSSRHSFNKRWSENNVFKTEAEAKRKKEIFDKLYELRHDFSLEEWERTNIYKHYIIYNYRNRTLISGFAVTTQIHNYYFKTQEKAQEFIDFCGKEDYLKYVLGVY